LFILICRNPCRERAPRRTRQAAQNVTGDARLCRDARSRDGSIRTELAAGVAPRCHWRRGLSRAERGTHADNLDNRHVEIFCATASARSMSAYFTNSLTPPTRLGLLGVAPRRGFLGRAARGSVAPRKMACRPLRGKAFSTVQGHQLAHRGGAAWSLPLLIGGRNGLASPYHRHC
jgi:hypothetical protein